jgi:Saxitoxin biosynthesis operon protein SxtJ
MATGSFYENFQREDTASGPSNRKFGLVVGAVLAVVALLKYSQGSNWYFWIAIAIALTMLAVFWPNVLTLPNKAWLKLGLLLHKITNPMIMGFLFFFTVLPTGLLLRVFGKDVLRLKWDREAKTYWIARSDTRPLRESMRHEF